jgi:hypothetical protein
MARCAQRNADYILEHWLVAVPSNAGARFIFVDQFLLQVFRGDARKAGRPVPRPMVRNNDPLGSAASTVRCDRQTSPTPTSWLGGGGITKM